MRIKNIIFGSILCFAGTACSSSSHAQPRTEEDIAVECSFQLPDVPATLKSPEERLHYVVRHYWDNFDFRDTAYIHLPEVTEQALVNYIDLLGRVPTAETDICLTMLLKAASVEPMMQDYLYRTLRHYLYEPNSPFLNDVLYEPVVRYMSADKNVDLATRSRAEYEWKMVRKNRVGTVANDFTYTLADGNSARLSRLRNLYTLLLFYEPDCESCIETIARIKSSPLLQRADMKGVLTILAVYPEEEIGKWRKYGRQLPNDWINVYDASMAIITNDLYDLRAMPTLYLLDTQKKVLLKDTSMEQVEEFFSSMQINE